MPSTLLDNSKEACETVQNSATVSLHPPLPKYLLQHGLICLPGLSCAVGLVTSLLSKASFGFTKTTIPTLFSEAHPRAESRLHR